jgi:NAD(P)-dependent dehydrogenase (short-subunit alcohol dehydrogenase family)
MTTSTPQTAGTGTGRLAGKVALVTGGSSGISRAVALGFARAGAAVAIADLREDPREGGAPTAEVIADEGGRAAFVRTDVTDAASVDQAVTQAVDELGQLDVLFTGAGIVDPTGDSREVDLAAFDRQFAINVRGTFACAQAALRHMVPRRTGSLVFVASNMGEVGVVGLATYCASKAAVIGLAKSLAVEFGPHGVRVNALCPGATRTAINVHTRADEATQELWQRMTPLRMEGGDYIADPDDIANAALFLASDESRFMTGSPLTVDGGWIAH